MSQFHPSPAEIKSSGHSGSESKWICIQIGARDHYVFPRALQKRGELAMLLTDGWSGPGFWGNFSAFGRSVSHRRHPELDEVEVHAPTGHSVLRELYYSLRGTEPWNKIQTRNEWFQSWALRKLQQLHRQGHLKGVTHCFAYSYAAMKIFEWCRSVGIRCVLGQVDPGPAEREIINKLREEHPEWNEHGEPPERYWEDWRRELCLAERVVVNSTWSEARIQPHLEDPTKTLRIPLAFEPGTEVASEPGAGTERGPMRILFLGQVCLRKGIHELVEAARILVDRPIVIDIVGEHGPLPADLPPNIRFHGRVGRQEVGSWFSQADLYVLPTHSDGFALTQLEAMQAGLPLVVTPNCARLIRDGEHGRIVPSGAPVRLAEALDELLQAPELRKQMGEKARAAARAYNLECLGNQLCDQLGL